MSFHLRRDSEFRPRLYHDRLWTLSLCACLSLAASAAPRGDEIEYPQTWTLENRAQKLLESGQLDPLDLSDQRKKSLERSLSNWTRLNAPPSSLEHARFYAPVCNERFCVACVELRSPTDTTAKRSLFGCLLLETDSYDLVREILMPAACEQFSVWGKPIHRPMIRSIKPTKRPPAELFKLKGIDPVFDVMVDSRGHVTSVPFELGAPVFEMDTRRIERWLTATFAHGVSFHESAIGLETIVELQSSAAARNKSVDLEIVETVGCRERTWRSSWPGSPSWQASDWRASPQAARCKPPTQAYCLHGDHKRLDPSELKPSRSDVAWIVAKDSVGW